MKKRFDDLTDVVEHAQNVSVPELKAVPQSERQVENAAGEKITLGEEGHPDRF